MQYCHRKKRHIASEKANQKENIIDKNSYEPCQSLSRTDEILLKCPHCKVVFRNQETEERHPCITDKMRYKINQDFAPTPSKRDSHVCKICTGEFGPKPVFDTDQDLRYHYLFGHKQRYFKVELSKRTDAYTKNWKWFCKFCKDVEEPNPVFLNNWDETLVHIGITHQKLYQALWHHRDSNLKPILKEVKR